MSVLGIDPGQKGAIAVITIGIVTKKTEAEVWKYPGDIQEVSKLMREINKNCQIELAVIEQAHSMPYQGAPSTFSFGMNYGAYLAILSVLEIPFEVVSPRKWQKACLDAGTGETKKRSLNMARRLFPKFDLSKKSDDGKADALHLARYGIQLLKSAHLP